jgi:uncharacterized protein with GYD domain
MPRYLVNATYTHEGVQGLLKEGGTARQVAVEKAMNDLGGSVEAFYYAFGDSDVVLIAEAPNNVTAAALSLIVGATGAVDIKTTVLLTPAEIDEATKMRMDYRPPGG